VASVEESVQTPAPVSAATVAPMDAAGSAAAQAKKEAAAAKRKATLAKKKEAAAASASTSTAAVATETVVTPAAASTMEPVADAGELRMLQGEFYWVVGSNVYEYDQIEEKPGDYVGRVRADETIDGDAEEEGAVESDGE